MIKKNILINHYNKVHGFYSKEYDIIYVPILKNAHTWGQDFFSHNFGCNEVVVVHEKNFQLFENTIFLAILRDPIDRWISAITQYLVAFDDPVKLLDDVIIQKIITDGIIFDDHAKTQKSSLLGINKNNIVGFMCDEKLEENINKFFLINFNLPAKSLVANSISHNVAVYDDSKKFLYPKIKNMVYQNEEIVNKLKKFYEIDYELIKSLPINIFYPRKRIPK